LVVSEKARTPQGPFVDNLGIYDPGTEPVTLRIDVAKTEEWIRKGAHPSPTVRQLLEMAKRRSA
jgi:small subunit ribosomal protein S16